MQCHVCKQDSAAEFLNLGQQPLANKYPTEAEFGGEDFFPLAVYFCTNCKNVQLGTVVSRERMFVDYYYLSSVNQKLVQHFESLAHSLAGAKFVVDVGSNDGILLKPLKALGVKALGVDPSVNVGKIANDAGLETIVSFFDSPTAQKIVTGHGKPDVVVASSIFTHLEDPHSFVDAVKELIQDDGQFIIEVEYIGNIIEGVQFERFYLDRIFYYSLSSLKHLFEMHGMYIADVEMIEPHGGSLRVTARNQSHSAPAAPRVAEFLTREETALTLPKLEEFRKTVDTYIVAFRDKLEEYKKAGVKVGGYSAPARVSTICNYGHIGPELIEFIIDDSPLKQHRHSPGTHIPILPKEHLAQHTPDILVVFAYEYFEAIKEKTKGGAWRYLIPIPPREVA